MERSTRSDAPRASTRDAPGAAGPEWVAPARRLAPLVDGIEYFAALRSALLGARREVWIVGWEFHSEIDLLRGDAADVDDGRPVRLADLLLDLVREREGLRIRILIWEGASLFALERQHVPRMKRPWASHPRLELAWDRRTPRMGSQHQKFVVVDGEVAFAGGMDLTKNRWDSHAHRPDDARRRAPGLWPSYFAPYHDLMLAVDGDAAVRLGEWARERWRLATGEVVAPPRASAADAGADPWPAQVEPILRDADVAAVLTWPALPGRVERRQVEAAFLEQLRAARRSIWIESQYFSVGDVADLLAERLREPDGPEVVLILPFGCPGRIQSLAMDPRRDALLDRLRAAAPAGRLFVGWPSLAGGATEDVFEHSTYVHAKALVVDDRLLRIGSANLANRSMGLDSELDLFVEVEHEDERGRAAVAGFRRRVLAHHLGCAPDDVARAERERGSMVGAIDDLRGGEHTLIPFEHRADGTLHAVPIPLELADPARPLTDADADRLMERIAEQATVGDRLARLRNATIGALRHAKSAWAAIAALTVLAVVWTLATRDGVVDPDAARAWLERAAGDPFGLALALVAFALLATLGFPVTALIVTTAAALGPWLSLPLSGLGVAASSSLGFLIGRRLRPERAATSDPERPRGRLAGLVARLEDRGVLSVALLRNLPVGPYALINVACGATRMPLSRFLAGTLIGMTPGLVAAAVLGGEIGSWLAAPDGGGLLRIALVVALVVALALVLRRRSSALIGSDGADARDGEEGRLGT